MKKIILAITFLLLTLNSAFAGIIDHPNIQNLNTLTNALISAVESKQAEFAIATGGEFFQGISLFDTEVIKPDGITSLDVNVDNVPSDKSTSWKTFDDTNFPKNLKLPINVKIQVHDSGAYGWAYTIYMEFWYDGIGPDAHGRDGNHWLKKVYKETGEVGVVTDWFIISDAPW